MLVAVDYSSVGIYLFSRAEDIRAALDAADTTFMSAEDVRYYRFRTNTAICTQRAAAARHQASQWQEHAAVRPAAP